MLIKLFSVNVYSLLSNTAWMHASFEENGRNGRKEGAHPHNNTHQFSRVYLLCQRVVKHWRVIVNVCHVYVYHALIHIVDVFLHKVNVTFDIKFDHVCILFPV